MPAATPSQPRTFELGQDYRPSQLQPGVAVVRQVTHSTTAVSSGSPCCLRASTMDYETIALAQREFRRNGQFRPFFPRKCAGCGWKYRIHIDPDVSPPLLRTVVWEVRP